MDVGLVRVLVVEERVGAGVCAGVVTRVLPCLLLEIRVAHGEPRAKCAGEGTRIHLGLQVSLVHPPVRSIDGECQEDDEERHQGGDHHDDGAALAPCT